MAERNAANGYIAIAKQTVDQNTPVTPTIYVPYYSQSLAVDPHFQSDEPVFGRRIKRLQTLQGMRSHGGSMSVMAEPDSAPSFHDMVMAKISQSGASSPYTYNMGESTTVEPDWWTVDVSYGAYVERMWGVGASKIGYGWEGEKMVLNLDVAGIGSFNGREIATISTNTITLKTDYDPAPNKGLVASDLVKITKTDGTTANFTVTTVNADGITVVLNATAAAFAAGDMLSLRPASPTLSFKTPFLWPRTEFYFAADAATAFTNSGTKSNQTRLDQGTELSFMYPFDADEGTKRSGGFDPASLVRTLYDADIKVKTFLDNPEKIKDWNALRKKAMIMRSFSETGFELRATINNMKALTNDHPTEAGKTIYHTFPYQPSFDTTDGQMFGVTILSPRSTI